jgi:hypothetical protein
VATYKTLSDGSIVITFFGSGASITLPDADAWGVGEHLPDWHDYYYAPEVLVPLGSTPMSISAFDPSVDLSDVQLALRQPHGHTVLG